MILNTNSEGWADMILHDGNGNIIINCFEYNTETKEVTMYVEDETYTPPANQNIICGRIKHDVNAKPITEKKVFPNSFIENKLQQ